MIRGSKKPIPVQREIHCGIHNRFDIEVQDAITGKVRQKARAFNVILNQFWNRATSTDNFSYIWYGNGSGTPAETDTGMFGSSWKVSATADTTGTDWANCTCYTRKKIVLSETTAVGVSISEVGVGTSSILCTHAMLQDMNGNPITILKTNTDIITIFATVYAHWDGAGYSNGKIWCYSNTLGGHLSNMHVPAPSNTSVVGFDPSHNSGAAINGGSFTYSSNDKTLTRSTGRIAVGDGNFQGGLRYITCGENGRILVFSLEGDYQITGEAVGTGDGTTTDFAFDFDFPKNARIYVDGAELSSGWIVATAPMLLPHQYLQDISPGSTPDNIMPCGLAPYVATGERKTYYYYNPFHEYGVKSFTMTYSAGGVNSEMYASDDFVTWNYLGKNNTITVPAQYKHSKFFRLNMSGSSLGGGPNPTNSAWPDDYPYISGKMLHFDTPPAAGAVITADYTCAFVPKDSNHVFDFSCTISFGNYEGP